MASEAEIHRLFLRKIATRIQRLRLRTESIRGQYFELEKEIIAYLETKYQDWDSP